MHKHTLQSHVITRDGIDCPAYVTGHGPTEELATLHAELMRAQRRWELAAQEYEAMKAERGGGPECPLCGKTDEHTHGEAGL